MGSRHYAVLENRACFHDEHTRLVYLPQGDIYRGKKRFRRGIICGTLRAGCERTHLKNPNEIGRIYSLVQ